MKKFIAALVLALALVGCSKGVADGPSKQEAVAGFPAGTEAFVAPGNRWTWVVPTSVNGVPCIVTVSNTNAGGGIVCDFHGEMK